MKRLLLVSLATVSLLLVLDIASAERDCCWGDNWLRMKSRERQAFVNGFIVGYAEGIFHTVCSQSDEPKTDCSKPNLLQSLDSERIEKSVTKFYKEYPDSRDLFPEEILYHLVRGRTLQEIHQRPFWSRERPPKP